MIVEMLHKMIASYNEAHGHTSVKRIYLSIDKWHEVTLEVMPAGHPLKASYSSEMRLFGLQVVIVNGRGFVGVDGGGHE